MKNASVQVQNHPPSGWTWKLVVDGKQVKSGNANSEVAARAAGNKAHAELIEESKKKG